MLDLILAKLRSEPVRARLYAVIVLASAYLLKKDVIDATDSEFAVALAAAVLLVERTRRKVSPARR